MPTVTARPSSPDATAAAAVEEARAAAVAVGGEEVGEHLGCDPLGSRGEGTLVDHYFACRHPGYRGWRWCVTVARAPRARTVTVDEVVLLPGSDALQPPAWVPWAERVQPGDLGPGDLVATPPDDDRLVPAYAMVEGGAAGTEPDFPAVAREFGLGRARVLSLEGRSAAADRWYAGEPGPDVPLARQAPARCGTCGFWLPVAGALGAAFGACANAVAPDDGRVVSADHGCGAHSEALPEVPPLPQTESEPPLVDDYRYEYELAPAADPAT